MQTYIVYTFSIEFIFIMLTQNTELLLKEIIGKRYRFVATVYILCVCCAALFLYYVTQFSLQFFFASEGDYDVLVETVQVVSKAFIFCKRSGSGK